MNYGYETKRWFTFFLFEHQQGQTYIYNVCKHGSTYFFLASWTNSKESFPSEQSWKAKQTWYVIMATVVQHVTYINTKCAPDSSFHAKKRLLHAEHPGHMASLKCDYITLSTRSSVDLEFTQWNVVERLRYSPGFPHTASQLSGLWLRLFDKPTNFLTVLTGFCGCISQSRMLLSEVVLHTAREFICQNLLCMLCLHSLTHLHFCFCFKVNKSAPS